MPEGFNSVADLKVIVDANADKFSTGIAGIQSILDGFGAKGNESLGGLDKIMALVGDTALSTRGKFNVLMNGLDAGVAVYQKLAQEGRAVAQVLGATEEYDRLKASIDDLGLSLKDTAVGAFFAVQSAGFDAASAMLGFASATDTGTESGENFAQKLLTRVADALDSVRLRVRLANAELATDAREITATIALLDEKVAAIRQRIARMQSGEEESTQRRAAGRSTREVDLVAEAMAEINRLEGERNRILGVREGLLDPTKQHSWELGTQTNISLLGEEIAALERRNATLGMSAAAAAEYNAVNRAIADAKRQNITLTDDYMEQIRREAAIVGALTQVQEDHAKALREAEREKQIAAQRERAQGQVFTNAEREIANLRVRAETVNLNAGAAAELAMQERLLQQLRASGNAVTADEMVRIRALSVEYGRLTERLADQQHQMRLIGETSQVFASNLSSGFARVLRDFDAFNDGTVTAKDFFREMTASILEDLAQLTLRRNVLEPLFGGGGYGGGSGGGLFGDFFGGLFGGYRADGGDVAAGRAYVVGERGPEYFIPREAGTVLPAGAGQSRAGGEIHVYVHGTPDFDARVVSTAEGVVAHRAPAIVAGAVEAVQDVRERAGLV